MTAISPTTVEPLAEQAMTAEKMIVDAIPEIVAKLIAMAKAGLVPAAKYLVDRVLGRPARVPARDLESAQAVDNRPSRSAERLPTTLAELASLCFPDAPAIDLNLALKSAKGHGARAAESIPGIGARSARLMPAAAR